MCSFLLWSKNMKKNSYAIDIETLSNPETSGYDIVIPNYAIVEVPDDLTSLLRFVYLKLPVQQQLDVGLKVGADTLDFWFSNCAKDYPNSTKEVLSTFKLETPTITTASGTYKVNNIPYELSRFFNRTREFYIYGNGCNFDCSILQANHKVLYGTADLWHYTAPQNARTLKNLLSEDEYTDMKAALQPHLDEFAGMVQTRLGMTLELHHPLYDAAREALQISYCLKLKKS